MLLKDLLDDIYEGEIDADFRHFDISGVSCDSRKATAGDIFIALKGSRYNGEEFIKGAINRGVRVIASASNDAQNKYGGGSVCFLAVGDVKEFLHKTANRLYGNPSAEVKTVGITGTNGKTTITYLIESIINESGNDCGVIGTVNYRHKAVILPSQQTTPSFEENQRFLYQLAQHHTPYCVMEVSSHALSQDRVDGIDFHAAVFTNLTSDHLDYHKTHEHYFRTKARLFTGLHPRAVAIINQDDLYGRQLMAMTEARLLTYGITRESAVMAKNIRSGVKETRFLLSCAQGEIEVCTALIGRYNIYNILAAAGFGISEGFSLETVKYGIESMRAVPGRLERVDYGQEFSVFIDYAHTEDALENVLTAVRQVSHTRIILVFGCGGDRDRSKRRLMGRVASDLADVSIVTSDNPRSEDPQAIIDQILPGFQRNNYEVIVDREKAIARALGMARAGDIVLIVGKGHESYQVLGDIHIDFNERDIIKKYI